MFDGFTDRARKVMQLANQEAQRFGHESIDVSHLLLALIKEGTGVGAQVLLHFGVSIRSVRLAIESANFPCNPLFGKLKWTKSLVDAINLSAGEARELGHNYIGTEHLLLGAAASADGKHWLSLVQASAEKIANEVHVRILPQLEIAAKAQIDQQFPNDPQPDVVVV